MAKERARKEKWKNNIKSLLAANRTASGRSLTFFLIRLMWDGVQLGPLGTAATDCPIVVCPGWLWWWRIWWNEDWHVKPKYSEKTSPRATSSTTNPTWPDPGSNPSRRGGKPATNRLSYGAALLTAYKICWNSPQLQSMYKWVLLSHGFMFRTEMSGISRAVAPAASVAFHSSSRELHRWAKPVQFQRSHKQKSAGERSGDHGGHTTGAFLSIHRHG
jgi:hypothetical protein